MTRTRAAAIGAACLAIGYAWGNYHATPAHETHHEARQEAIAIQASETTEATEIAEHAASEATAERTEAVTERVKVVWREKITTPEGGTKERSLEVDAETARLVQEAAMHRQEVASLRAQLASRQSMEALAEATLDLRRELTPAQPDWRLSAMIGLDIPRVQAVYGGSIERRILGPIHVGAWGLSSGALGGSVGVAW